MTQNTRERRLSTAFVRLADTMTADYDMVDLLDMLVRECVELLDTSAGGLMLVDTSGANLHLVASTSEEANFVEINQLNGGEGPCLDCFSTGVAVSVDDISRHGDQWPRFQRAAADRGFLSMHAFPLRLRGTVIGTMNLFSTTTGVLSDDDRTVAQALADVATIGILQERSLRDTTMVTEQLQRALDSRVYIEQAKGIIAQSAGLDMDAAFTILRAYARNHGETIRSVSERVAARTLDLLPGGFVRK